MEILKIHGYIGKDENFYSLERLDKDLAALPSDSKELTVEINSGGGSVVEGFAIRDRLKSLKLELYTDVIGQCSSIATVIGLAAKPENRSISTNAEYGVHFPYWEPERAEAFEAEDLINLGNELMGSKKKILALYEEETGTARNILYDLMEQQRSLSAQEAKKYGFVSIINNKVSDAQRYRIAAFMEKTKSTDMEFTASQKSWIENMFSQFSKKWDKLLSPVFKNMAVDLENGSKIWIDSEDEDITGKMVFLADDKGEKTAEAAPDGEYKLKSGKTIKVASGKITEVIEPVNETEALKKQVADLTAQLETANQKAQTADTAKAALETNVLAIKAEFTAFKNQIITKDIPGAEQTFKGDTPLKTEQQQWLEYKKAKAEKAKNLK